MSFAGTTEIYYIPVHIFSSTLDTKLKKRLPIFSACLFPQIILYSFIILFLACSGGEIVASNKTVTVGKHFTLFLRTTTLQGQFLSAAFQAYSPLLFCPTTHILIFFPEEKYTTEEVVLGTPVTFVHLTFDALKPTYTQPDKQENETKTEYLKQNWQSNVLSTFNIEAFKQNSS